MRRVRVALVALAAASSSCVGGGGLETDAAPDAEKSDADSGTLMSAPLNPDVRHHERGSRMNGRQVLRLVSLDEGGVGRTADSQWRDPNPMQAQRFDHRYWVRQDAELKVIG